MTCSGNTKDADDAAAGNGYVDTAVPFHGCLWTDTRDLPRGRPQAGDRHLNFHENRDNLIESIESHRGVDWANPPASAWINQPQATITTTDPRHNPAKKS